MVDVSVGTPVDPMPDVAVRALVDAAPGATGLPGDHRQRRPTATRRRRGSSAGSAARSTPDEVVACIGTKELVASLPRALSLRDPSRDTVLYPAVVVPDLRDGRARSRGCARCRCRSTSAGTSTSTASIRPTPTRALRALAQRPEQPDRRRPRRPARCAASVAWARERGVIVASDECYAEFTYDDDRRARRIRSPRSTAGADGVLAVHSLSKRSNMAGLRAGFVAGDRELVAYLGEVRKHGGLMTPAPVQAAAAAALGDDEHVREQQLRYARRRAVALPALEARGLVHDGGPSTFYLWLRDADGARDGWAIAADLADDRAAGRARRLLRRRGRRPRAASRSPSPTSSSTLACERLARPRRPS